MKNSLTNTGTTETALEHMRRVRDNTIAKWGALGFLDGLSANTKQNIAELYQCEAYQLLNETRKDTDPDFEPMLPIVKRAVEKWQKLKEDEEKDNS